MEFALTDAFKDSLGENKFDFGFILPGHGFKGKQLLLSSDSDLDIMYNHYKGKSAVRVWLKCIQCSSKKRARPDSEEGCGPKTKRSAGQGYDSHMKKMDEVEIFEELHDKHSKTYSPEQVRAWAHMIQMKKHSSYENAPDKPFFRKKQAAEKSAVSPGKRINLRSKCIDQLEKWHCLLERGAITQTEYDELQQTILGDIKKF